MQPCTSRQSLGSVMSGESRGYGATCQTARYRGSIVRVKELHYEKKKDIPRSVMKEMKQMREMRHDNINRQVEWDDYRYKSYKTQVMIRIPFSVSSALA